MNNSAHAPKYTYTKVNQEGNHCVDSARCAASYSVEQIATKNCCRRPYGSNVPELVALVRVRTAEKGVACRCLLCKQVESASSY